MKAGSGGIVRCSRFILCVFLGFWGSCGANAAGDEGKEASEDLSAQIEAAIREVQSAEEEVRRVMREVEYTDPECSQLKRELVELERRVLELRQQLTAAIRASEPVQKAEARRREAAWKLQRLREQQRALGRASQERK